MKKSKVFRIVALVLVFALSLTMTVGVFADGGDDPPPEPTEEVVESGGEETGGEELPVPEPKEAPAAPAAQSLAAPAAADSSSGEVGSTTTNPAPEDVVDANNNENYDDDCSHAANCESGSGDENQHTFTSTEQIEVVVVHTGVKNGHNHFIDFQSGTPEDCGAASVYCGTEEYDSNSGTYTYTIYGNDGFDGKVQGISNTTFWNIDDDPEETPTPEETETPEETPTPEETETPESEKTATPVPGPSTDPKTGVLDGGLFQAFLGLLGMFGSGFGIFRIARRET